jgi:hypothetical protein
VQPNGVPQPQGNVGQFQLVYGDENLSMEEVRAELERYQVASVHG